MARHRKGRIEILEDLLENSKIIEDCWIWQGSTRGQMKYAQVTYLGRQTTGHRAAFHIVNGRWPSPCGLHRCHNPRCVNPQHVYEGTYSQNMLDTWNSGSHGERMREQKRKNMQQDKSGKFAEGRKKGAPIGLKKMNGDKE